MRNTELFYGEYENTEISIAYRPAGHTVVVYRRVEDGARYCISRVLSCCIDRSQCGKSADARACRRRWTTVTKLTCMVIFMMENKFRL